MSTPSLTGTHKPGAGALHRLRPGAKLIGLFVFAVLVVAFRGATLGTLLGTYTGTISTTIALIIGLALALLAGMRSSDLLRVLRRFVIVAVLLFAFQTWQNGWLNAYEVVGGLLALILAASAFTASTAVDEMLDTITWALGPLRRFGAKPESVALAFSLTITSIPVIMGVAAETRSAAKARGLERNPRALLVPFALRTVAHAQLTGEALAARGLGDE